MSQRNHYNWIATVVGAAVLIGPAISPALAQPDPDWLCEGARTFDHPLPEYINPLDVVWDVQYEIAGGPERVAVVVWDDPSEHLYNVLSAPIDTYAQDVAAAGFTVDVVKFYGMAEDPLDPDAHDLRWQLKQVYDDTEAGSLAGAVLVGNVQHLLYEYDKDDNVEVFDIIDFPCDMLLGDMDGEIYDNYDEEDEPPGEWGDRVFDTWDSANGEIEIWTSRIIARPELCDYFGGATQVQILTDYFARNHNDRWNAFNSSGKALLYCADMPWPEYELAAVTVLNQLFGYNVTSLWGAETTYTDYIEVRLPDVPGYAHIHFTGHGNPDGTCHFIGGGVCREHYVAIDPLTMSYVFESCNVFNFANPAYIGPCLGEVVVFNQEAPTLVGFGSTKGIGPTDFSYYYGELVEGHCLGEGYKAQVNHYGTIGGAGGMVLLGDGTLKRWGETVQWDGGGPLNYWTIDENWSEDIRPMPTDNVLHDNEDVIEVDVGTAEDPEPIMGFEGDGALGGGLAILDTRGLEIGADAVFSNGYDVTLVEPPPGQQTKLAVNGAIFGGDFTLNDRCELQVGAGAGAQRSVLSGTWLLDGPEASAWFAKAEGSASANLLLTLKNGARLDLDDMPYGTKLFPDRGALLEPAHDELVYEGSGNELEVGLADSPQTQSLWIGDYTRIQAVAPETDPDLNLNLYCQLDIASDFRDAFVCNSWDSRGVDITARPIDGAGQQAIELITPAFAVWYHDPFSFLDVPCHGAFRDLILPEVQADPPTPTAMRNLHDNSELGWPAARGLFQNVTIGANRTLEFYSDEGVIHFHGQAEVDLAATVKLDGYVVDWDQVIIEVPGTIYGDWNGDCTITNVELAELQDAIRGAYNQLMDYDCDGELTSEVELPAFLANMAQQASCGFGLLGGGGGGFGEEWPLMEGEPMYDWPLFDEWVPYEDVPGLAAWLIEQLSPEDLAATIEALTTAAVEFADTPVGYDIAELLSYLE